MTLSELSIRRHVFAVMLSAVLVLFGAIAYLRMGVDKLPYIEFPIISITTAYKGANPDIIDAAVTNLIETSVNSVPGIEHIQSTSSPGTSVVVITFSLEKRIDVAFQEVQAKVNQVLRRLPKDADPPVVAKVESNTQPILQTALQGDRTQQQLNLYAINVIKKQLETIDGVGEVRIGGRRDRTIRVNLQPSKMAGFGIAAQDITDAFGREHIQMAGGFLVGRTTEHLVKIDLEFHKLDDLAAMIVGYKDGAPVRLRDIAEIEDGLADFRQLARLNGKPAVGIGIVKVPNTNTVEIIDRVIERIDRDIRPQLPPGLELHIVQSDKIFIGAMVEALKNHLIEGTILAALIVWLFLKSFRSTVIIATSIPVSLMGAIAVMYFFGYTFNSVTLLALLLLVGVVVDDAIVVLENIYRHREEDRGTTAMSAAITGSREVTFAVIAASFSLVAIFAAGGVRERHPRTVPALVRGGGHLRRAGVAVRFAHAHADALLALPRCPGEARQGVLGARAHVRVDRPLLPPDARLGAGQPDHRAVPRRALVPRRDPDLRHAAARARAAGRRGPLPGRHPHPARLVDRVHRDQAARGGGGRQDATRRSSPSSASSAWARRSRSTRRRWWRA